MQPAADAPIERDALLLTGFDRLTPTQNRFIEAWGPHEVLSEDGAVENTQFYAAQDAASELAACILPCSYDVRCRQ